MRLITFVLSSGIALTCIPAWASAERVGDVNVSAVACPAYEGYPDCHPDVAPAWAGYSSSSRPGRAAVARHRN
jgi:hypothetical protein